MASVSQSIVTGIDRVCRRIGPMAIALALACCPLVGGCLMTTMPWTTKKEPVPENRVFQVATTWENQVFFVPDNVHGGRPTPCLAGRMYLFGSRMDYPIKADGKVTVKLFLEGPTMPNGQPQLKLLEQWNIDADTLCNKLGRPDAVGWGYSLALPWSTHNLAITTVQISVCYTPKDGAPMYAQPSRLRLRHNERQFHMSNRMQSTVPAGLPRGNGGPFNGGVSTNVGGLVAPPFPKSNRARGPGAGYALPNQIGTGGQVPAYGVTPQAVQR